MGRGCRDWRRCRNPCDAASKSCASTRPPLLCSGFMRKAFPPPGSSPDPFASDVRNPAIDEVERVAAQLHGEIADLEIPGAGGGDRGHFGRAAGQEELLEIGQFLRPDRPLDPLDAALAGEVDRKS